MGNSSEPVVDAMQAALAGEHAAVYAYGVIGGRLDYGSNDQELATRLHSAHRSRRDELTDLLTAAGAKPAGAEPAYDLPGDIETAEDARPLGQQVEDRCTVLSAGIVAVATGTVRSFAVTAQSESAVALLEWGGAPTALPGVERP